MSKYLHPLGLLIAHKHHTILDVHGQGILGKWLLYEYLFMFVYFSALPLKHHSDCSLHCTNDWEPGVCPQYCTTVGTYGIPDNTDFLKAHYNFGWLVVGAHILVLSSSSVGNVIMWSMSFEECTQSLLSKQDCNCSLQADMTCLWQSMQFEQVMLSWLHNHSCRSFFCCFFSTLTILSTCTSPHI